MAITIVKKSGSVEGISIPATMVESSTMWFLWTQREYPEWPLVARSAEKTMSAPMSALGR
jgi:hypothetical protein